MHYPLRSEGSARSEASRSQRWERPRRPLPRSTSWARAAAPLWCAVPPADARPIAHKPACAKLAHAQLDTWPGTRPRILAPRYPLLRLTLLFALAVLEGVWHIFPVKGFEKPALDVEMATAALCSQLLLAWRVGCCRSRFWWSRSARSAPNSCGLCRGRAVEQVSSGRTASGSVRRNLHRSGATRRGAKPGRGLDMSNFWVVPLSHE